MKFNLYNIFRLKIIFILVTLIVSSAGCKDNDNIKVLTTEARKKVNSVNLYYDTEENAIEFAAKDLMKILRNMGSAVNMYPLTSLKEPPKGIYFVIGKNDSLIQSQLVNEGGHALASLGEQEYSLRVTGDGTDKGYWSLGGDRIGAMYGGIHIGEIISGGSLKNIKDGDYHPYIEKRGLKVNIPLDERTPSFDDGGWAANTNRDDVWDLSFWKEYFDVLAKQRYNVVSLWNRHPFPSMVNVEGFEKVSIKGVIHKDGSMVNKWTIHDKIKFWNEVFELAYNRGIEVWPVVWNVELHWADGKYGITREKGNKPAMEYLRKATTQLFVSYPRLAGIGVTAGEKMDDYTDSEKEQWVWETYGQGVMDAKKLFPDRKIRFVHRHWLTDWKEIETRFSKLPDGFELALKYAQARLYSATNPSWATRQLSGIPKEMGTWWNLRNDDIYVQRWGDPDYVKEYILNFPHKSKPCIESPCLTAGYVMGSDRYFWARESMSKNPQSPRQLENEKHWYKFLLWGRLGYDPNTPKELLLGLMQYRFPSIDAAKIYEGWQAASKTIPMVNRFHYWNWDYFWWVEQGTGNEWSDIDGYHTINHVIDNATQDVSGYTNIKDFVNGDTQGTSPLLVADSLESFGIEALAAIDDMSSVTNIELKETLSDIRSQAHFGIYWAHKIRGGVELELFRKNKNDQHKKNAISYLKKSLEEWKKYASALGNTYEKGVIAGHHQFDWDAITLDVEKDIEIAQDSK